MPKTKEEIAVSGRWRPMTGKDFDSMIAPGTIVNYSPLTPSPVAGDYYRVTAIGKTLFLAELVCDPRCCKPVKEEVFEKRSIKQFDWYFWVDAIIKEKASEKWNLKSQRA